MDDCQARAMQNLTKRHEDAIRENAERIQEAIGYLMTRLDSGHPVSHFAAGIAVAAQDIVRCLAVLDALSEATDILATKENDR